MINLKNTILASFIFTAIITPVAYAQSEMTPQEFIEGYEHCNNTNTSPTVYTNCLNKLMAKKNGTEFTPIEEVQVKKQSNPIIIAKCSSEWADDYEMQEYCQENQYEALAKWDIVSKSTDKNLSKIVNKCDGDWPKDYVMKFDCYEKQGEALKVFAQYFETDNLQLKTIATKCIGKWGPDYVMAEYCTSNQVGAFNRLNKN